MINEGELPMPLGVRTALLDVKLSESELEELGLVAPDRYYVLNFEESRAYGPIIMQSSTDGSNFYSEWVDYANRIGLNERNVLVSEIASQINWNLIIAPMFAKTMGFFYGRYICNYLVCFRETFYGATIAYLSANDPQALVDLGADYNLVWRLRNSLHSLEQKYINKMAEEYKSKLIPEYQATPWDKMWMAYFGYQFYEPPPPPPPQLEFTAPKIILAPPFIATPKGLGISGKFAKITVENVGDALTIIVKNLSTATKLLSEMAIYVGDPYAFGGYLSIKSEYYLSIIKSAIANNKWVFCSDNFYTACRLITTPIRKRGFEYITDKLYVDAMGRINIRDLEYLSLISPLFIGSQQILNSLSINVLSIPL